MTEWIRVAAEADFGSEMRVYQVGRKKIAVAKLDGEFFAFDAYCPHVAGPMHRAEVDGAIVTCPFHAWRFDLRNNGRELHGYRPLPVYEVRVEGGEVRVLAEAGAQALPVEARPCRMSFVPA